MEVKRDIVCNQQQGWFSRLWGTRGQRKLGEFIEHRTQKEIFGFRRNQIGHEIEGQTRRTKHLFRCHNVSSPKTNLERDHGFACSVRGVFWGVVVGLRPAPGCICKRWNWNICFLNSGSETTCHDLGWLNTFHNLSNFIVSVVRAYFNINLIGSLLAFSHACFGTANLFYGRASLVEVCFCKILSISIQNPELKFHSNQVKSRSRSSVGFLSGFAVDTVSAESYSLGLRDAQEQRLTRLLGVLVEEHSSLRPSIHRMCFCWREVKGKEKLFWRCICRWQWTRAWCLMIGCQEVSNKELQKALRHMRKAEDQYYSSKGWPFGLNLSWEARFKTCVAVTCSHGSQALRFWSCDDRCQKNYDKYNMARQTAATQQCTNHDIISGYHTRKD